MFIGCGEEDNGINEPICICNSNTSNLPCKCEVAGTEKCNCVETPIGYISEYMTGLQIPIYRNISQIYVDNNSPELYRLKNEYDKLCNENKNILVGKIKEIRFLFGDSHYYLNEIFGIGVNYFRNTYYIENIFYVFIIQEL
jgi:hypothetical protein